MIDMHTHVLPGVDDGAKDEKMAQEMLARAKDAGVSAIVCTPHVYRLQDWERNRLAVPAARALAHEQGLRLFAGSEFNYRMLAKTEITQLDAFCLAGTKCLLLEFSNEHLVPGWEPLLSDLSDAGYLPVIAHPERYVYIQRDIEIAQTMLELGCELQLDAGGLMSSLFGAERKTARKLLSEGMVSYIASDAHRPEDYARFQKAQRTFREEWPYENRLSNELKKKSAERPGGRRGIV